MKNTVLYLIVVITSTAFHFNCSVDVNKTGALLEVTPSLIRFTQIWEMKR